MNRRSMRWVACANLVSGFLLLQGCGMFSKEGGVGETVEIPEQEPVVVTPLEPLTPEVVVPESVEIPVIQTTTPYTIKKGDTISGVAYRHKLRWQDVVAINPGINPKRLRIGQVIQLPGQVEVRHAPSVRTPPVATPPKTVVPSKTAVAPQGSCPVYIVKPGDSLSVIALRNKTTVAAIREANGLKGDLIRVGQKLTIPCGAKPAVPAPTAKKSGSAPKTEAPQSTAAAKPQPPTPPETVTEEVAPPPKTRPDTPADEKGSGETAPEEENLQTYTVKEGEDVYTVAIRWGVSPSNLQSLNNLTSSDLKPGTVLKIPRGAQ